MTPQFWHWVAERVEPNRRRLMTAANWGMLSAGLLFGAIALIVRKFDWIFLGLWLVLVQLFWCIGLWLVIHLYRTVPTRSGGLISLWNWAASWYGAVFLSFWFAGLSFMTFVAPVLMAVAFAR